MKTATNVVLKAKAKALREAMAKAGFTVKHTQALEILAAVENEKNWNVLAAKTPELAATNAMPELTNILEFIQKNHDDIWGLCWDGLTKEMSYNNGQQACPAGDQLEAFGDEDPVLFEIAEIQGVVAGSEFRRSEFLAAAYLGNYTWKLASGHTVSFMALTPLVSGTPAPVNPEPIITDLVELLNTYLPILNSGKLNDIYYQKEAILYLDKEEEKGAKLACLYFCDERGEETTFELDALLNNKYLGEGAWLLVDGTKLQLNYSMPATPEAFAGLSARPLSVVSAAKPVEVDLVVTDLLKLLTPNMVDIVYGKINGKYQEEARLQYGPGSGYTNSDGRTFGPIESLWFSDDKGNETEYEINDLVNATYLGTNSWKLQNGDVLSELYFASEFGPAKPVQPEPDFSKVNFVADSNRKINLVWSVEDVQGVAPGLTEAQAIEVLQTVKRRHDAEIGVNWDVLRETAEWVVTGSTRIRDAGISNADNPDYVAELLVMVHLVNVANLADVSAAITKLQFSVVSNAVPKLKFSDIRFDRMLETPTFVGANQASCVLVLQHDIRNASSADELTLFLAHLSVDVTGPKVAEFELMDSAVKPKPKLAAVVNSASDSPAKAINLRRRQIVLLSMKLNLQGVATVEAAQDVISHMDYSINSGTDGVSVVDCEIVTRDAILPPVHNQASACLTIQVTIAADRHQDESDIQDIVENLDFTFNAPEIIESSIFDYYV